MKSDSTEYHLKRFKTQVRAFLKCFGVLSLCFLGLAFVGFVGYCVIYTFLQAIIGNVWSIVIAVVFGFIVVASVVFAIGET